jgi:hypothetical protein
VALKVTRAGLFSIGLLRCRLGQRPNRPSYLAVGPGLFNVVQTWNRSNSRSEACQKLLKNHSFFSNNRSKDTDAFTYIYIITYMLIIIHFAICIQLDVNNYVL